MLWRRAQSVADVAEDLPLQRPLAPPTFNDLYEAHVDFLWRNARRLGVHDDAVDDVLQQVFMVVHRRLPEVSLAGSEKAWMFGVLRRVVGEHRRLLRRKSPHRFWTRTDPETLADLPSRQPDELIACAEAAALVQKWLQKLSPDKREVFVLSELEQMTAREIAEATGTNQSTVYSRLGAARQAFEAEAERHRRRESRRR